MEMQDLFPGHPTPRSFRNIRFVLNDGARLTYSRVSQTMAGFGPTYLPRFWTPVPGMKLSWNFAFYVLGNADVARTAL